MERRDTATGECRDYLNGLTLHGVKLGLSNISGLLAAAGDPHRQYPTVHIAGTNGKGSVAAILSAALRAAGYRTGCFTSPHLIRVNERFQVDAESITDDALDEQIAFFRDAGRDLPHPPTYFEMCTAVALRYFAERSVDIAVVEVGMGGRLDSTNVVVPLATAVTNIDLEHTQFLGNSLEEIAFEKAGIIKSGVPVVVGETHPAPQGVILNRAAEVGGPVVLSGRDYEFHTTGTIWQHSFSYRGPHIQLEETPLALSGSHQGENAAVAVALAESIKDHFPRLGPQAVQEGLASVQWPCRIERVLEAPPVIIDVAHNVAGATELARLFEACVTVLAVASDKNASGMISALAPCSETLILTEFSGGRALSVERLQEAAEGLPVRVLPSLREAIGEGMAHASDERPLLVTGSVFTAGEARQILVDEYGAAPLCF